MKFESFMKYIVNPFLAIQHFLAESVNSLSSIWYNDRDDLVEDATKIGGLILINRITIVMFGPISVPSLILINTVSYIAFNEIGDYLGDYIDGDDSNDPQCRSSPSTAKFVGKLAADITEDSFKVIFIAKHWVIGTGLEVVNKNIPYPWNIAAKIASHLYTCIDLLEDYSEWNQFSDGVGNWLEGLLGTNPNEVS